MSTRILGPFITRRQLSVALLLTLSQSGWSQAVDEPGPQTTPETNAEESSAQPQPLPESVVDAWTAAGAEAGWMRSRSVSLFPEFDVFLFLESDLGEPGDIPAFRFSIWPEGGLSRLPVPASPFGLDLPSTGVTDAGLAELAGLTNLQALDLGFTSVTDAGLAELAGLANLQTLDLGLTSVTDAGLAELAGLANLQVLDLSFTRVTDAGLVE